MDELKAESENCELKGNQKAKGGTCQPKVQPQCIVFPLVDEEIL
jgi:hypothetical protein